MAVMEPIEEKPPEPHQHDHDEALKRLGWAILAINSGKYHAAELHLAAATANIQRAEKLKRLTEASR